MPRCSIVMGSRPERAPPRVGKAVPLDAMTYTIYGRYMSDLTKTTVYVSTSDYRRLKSIAREQKRTAADLVREAIAEYARRHGGTTLPRSLGAGRSGRHDLSERAEELLSGLGRER